MKLFSVVAVVVVFLLVHESWRVEGASIVVKRDAEEEEEVVDAAAVDATATDATTEARIAAVSAVTESSLLDFFSTSTKEEKKKKEEVSGAVVKSLHVYSNVTFRYAVSRVESRILNPAPVAQEVFFDFIIPETAFISGFAMEIDGKIYEAYVKEKLEAQKVYDAAVKKGITAGHVKQSARDSNRFSVSVNVESMKKVKFNLTYEELLERKFGTYRHVVNLNPGQVVDDMLVEISVQEMKPIVNLRVPNFQSGNEIYPELDGEDFGLATVEKRLPTEAKVTFRPSPEQQKQLQKTKDKELPEGLSGRFAVEYDVERDAEGGEILVNDGYFVHFFAPPNLPPLRKHVVFVLDVSGSMSGRKIEQLKEAMDGILGELNPHDYFNIIEFAFSVTARDLDLPELSPEYNPWIMPASNPWGSNATRNATAEDVKPYPATPENVAKGKKVVQKMIAAGGTNIYDALDVAVSVAQNGMRIARSEGMEEAGRSPGAEPMIIFLTDGEPTVGQTSESQIIKNVAEKNIEPIIPIFSLAFGTDADFRLLKRVSLVTNGFARQIYEAADTSLQLKNFYKQISSPTLSHVKFVYPPEQVKDETITRVNFTNFFGGSEIVVAGKLDGDAVEGEIGRVEAQAIDGVHNYSVIFMDRPPPVLTREKSYKPLERLWVYMTIKKLLDEAELIKAKSYLLDYKEKPLELSPENKALRLALEAAKEAFVSAFRLIVECLWSKLKVLQSLVQSGEFVYVDSTKPGAADPVDGARELALKYSFVCPLTSLVVVKPNSLTDASVEPALDAPTPHGLAQGSPAGLYQANPLRAPGPLGPVASSMMFAGGSLGLPYVANAATTMPDLTSRLSTASPESFIVKEKIGESSLSSLTWLDSVLTGDVLHFPGDVNSTDYILGKGEANDSFGECSVTNSTASGECRHLEHCVLDEFATDVDAYFSKYFCVIPGNYAGVCCPGEGN